MDARPTLQIIDLSQHNLRAGPHAGVVRQVDPPDCARGVHQKLGGPGDVPAVFASACMQDSVAANHVRFRIGQKGEGITLVLAELVRLRVGVYADGHNPDAARAKFV